MQGQSKGKIAVTIDGAEYMAISKSCLIPWENTFTRSQPRGRPATREVQDRPQSAN